MEDDNDDNDELRAALALSMQSHEKEDQCRHRSEDVDDNNYVCHLEDFDCRSFNSLMWNDAGATTTTTDNDKERWIYESITTPFLRQQREKSKLKREDHRLKQSHGGGEGGGGGGGGGGGQTLPLDAGSASSDVGGHVHDENDVDVIGVGRGDEVIEDRNIGDAPTPLDVFTGSSFGTSPSLLPHPSQKKRRKRQLSAYASTSAANAAVPTIENTIESTAGSSSKPRPLPLQLWGLVQTHGGPCGVLAAVQAEMIRVLLFGRKRRVESSRVNRKGSGVGGGKVGTIGGCRGDGRDEDDNRDDLPDGDEDNDDSYFLYYPHEPTLPSATNADDTTPPSPITEREAKKAMAMAIGMILARAALASSSFPPSSCTSPNDEHGLDEPIVTTPPQPQQKDDPPFAVKLVLPTSRQHRFQIHDESLSSCTSSGPASCIREMLGTSLIAPADVTAPITLNKTMIASGSDTATDESSLMGHVISAMKSNDQCHFSDDDCFDEVDSDIDTADDGQKLPEMKRPRNNHDSDDGKGRGLGEGQEKTMTKTRTSILTPEQRKLNTLAMSVADFLLSNHRRLPGGWEENSNFRGTVETLTVTDADSVLLSNTDGSAVTAADTSSSTPLDYFQGPGGVIFLVMSLVTTRGIDKIRDEMDDPNSTMTSQFGHSSQELMNLLLTGRAVSNVFDNSMTLSESLTCHGIQARSDIGYLTILESLNYCEVGGNYKSPVFPIWVVGSTSHFSVLFGDENCLKESKSDQLLEKCRRAFQKVEGGGGENGFIFTEKLGEVLQELDLMSRTGCDEGLQTLQAYLEVDGAGIILWDDFWKACSRLMTGSSLESILTDWMRPIVRQMDIDNDTNSIHYGPPLLITQFGEDKILPMTSVPAHQSDEELAKKLAAEWGSLHDQGEILTGITDSVHGQNMKSDEDYARELQAMWDTEITAAGHPSIGDSDNIDLTSQVATTDDVGVLESDDDDDLFAKSLTPSVGTTTTTATTTNDETTDNIQDKSRGEQLGLDEQGHSFSLFHYNGLHGGCLTRLRLTKLSTEAVGASIALSSKGSSGHGAGGCDLEDVVRTKWPSSMMNWFGKNPPSIE